MLLKICFYVNSAVVELLGSETEGFFGNNCSFGPNSSPLQTR